MAILSISYEWFPVKLYMDSPQIRWTKLCSIEIDVDVERTIALVGVSLVLEKSEFVIGERGGRLGSAEGGHSQHGEDGE
jgi:hypothetical protein